MEKGYSLKKVEGGYRVISPRGQELVLLANSIEAAKIIANCHKEKRLPTNEEKAILWPKLQEKDTSPITLGSSSFPSIKTSFGNQTFR